MLRFDDSLDTVLSADMSSPLGAQSTWRQLVDLIGRRRVAVNDTVIARLRAIRGDVPPPVRGASARALIMANAPAALVALFAEDDIPIAAPVLRSAQLSVDEWTALLPGLSPAARSVLRHRRDLHPEVTRALESFGRVDFLLTSPMVEALLGSEPLAESEPPHDVSFSADPAEAERDTDAEPTDGDTVAPGIVSTPESEPRSVADAKPAPATPIPATIASPSSFVPIAVVAAGLPMVAQALREAERYVPLPAAEPTHTPEHGPFQIAELVARIDAFQREREQAPVAPRLEIQPELFAHETPPANSFRYETDAAGIVRWVDGAARAPLIGLSLHLAALPHGARVDGVAAGAFRRRARFAKARLVVDGHSDAAGQWRIAGIPVFDRASGRFTGYRGTARRPHADETAEPPRDAANPAADALRQIVHELRTPTTAIAGFAEMIESQVLGAVPDAYRDQAAAIRRQTSGLLTAIDDIDIAARIETNALDLYADDVPVAPLLDRVLANLAPLATLRGAVLARYVGDGGGVGALAILGDDRAVERLIARLMATLVTVAGTGERIGVAATREDNMVSIVFDRPHALDAHGEDGLLTIDPAAAAESTEAAGGAPLLGSGFALRLARKLAAELHGSLTIDDRTLTLRLPAVCPAEMEQASNR